MLPFEQSHRWSLIRLMHLVATLLHFTLTGINIHVFLLCYLANIYDLLRPSLVGPVYKPSSPGIRKWSTPGKHNFASFSKLDLLLRTDL
jgi:hypothetical protein